MRPQLLNIRTVMLFFLGAALLNIANYTIYSITAWEQHKIQSSKPISSNTLKPTSRASIWDALLTCTGISTTQKLTTTEPTTKISTESTELTSDDISADSSFEYTESNAADNTDSTTMANLCPVIPPGLGPITTAESLIDSVTKNTFGEIFKGGYYKTSECRPQQSVAIIIPHRGDKKLMKIFLHYLHSFLIRQQAEYQIYVVENANQSMPFNRGQLFNIGFSEVQKQRKRRWPCLILHDAYLVPMDLRNLYRCTWYPRQLVAAVEVTPKVLTPKIGGVIAIIPSTYSKVNGFSNLDWKSDVENNDFYRRILMTNFTVERSDMNIGKYRYLKWHSTFTNGTTVQTTTITPQVISDGLFNLSYKARVEYFKLYTHINVTDHTVAVETMEKLNMLRSRGIRRTTMPSRNLKETVVSFL